MVKTKSIIRNRILLYAVLFLFMVLLVALYLGTVHAKLFLLSSIVLFSLYYNKIIKVVKNVKFIKINNIESNILIKFALGSCVSYKLYPNNCPTGILHIQKIIPVYSTLEKLSDWVKIYEGNLCGVFIKRSRLKKNYKLPNDNIEYYKKNEFVNNGYFGKGIKQND